MTDQPTLTHDDDPAKRAIDIIRAESEDRVLPWSHAETIVRSAYAPLIASVRELLTEIHPVDGFTDLIPLMQYTTDAIEAVRKERERTREWSLALQSLTPGGSEFVDDPNRCIAHVRGTREFQHETIVRQQRQLGAAKEQIADLTQTSGALCETCGWRGNRGDGCAFCGLVAANAENERLRAELLKATNLNESFREAERHYRRQIAERDALPSMPHQKYPTESEGRAYRQGLYDSHYRIQRNYGADHRRNSAHFDGLMQGARWEGVVEHLRQKTRPPQPPDQERVEPDTLCHYQFYGHRIVGRCGVLRSKHGAVKDHEFVADPPVGQPSEPSITTAECTCGDPVHPSSVGVGLRHYSHGQYHLIEVRAGQEIEQPSEPTRCWCGHRKNPEHTETLDGRPYCVKCGFYMHRFSVDRPLTPSSPQATAPVECPCVDCGGRLVGTFYGAGDGTGQRFRCEACHWRNEATDLRAKLEIERGVIEGLRALDASKLPCGCNASFALTTDGGKTGVCTVCEIERLLAKLTEAEREQTITAKVIQSQQETIRKLTPCCPIDPQVRERVAIQVLRVARELTEYSAVEAWRLLGLYWRRRWLMKADRIIAIFAGEQEGRS